MSDEDSDDERCPKCGQPLQQCIYCFADFCPSCTTGGDECEDCLNALFIEWEEVKANG